MSNPLEEAFDTLERIVKTARAYKHGTCVVNTDDLELILEDYSSMENQILEDGERD